ncbi:MAG: FAD-binding protein, partial [Bacteroidota bacterium]
MSNHSFVSVSSTHLDQFRQICGAEHVLVSTDARVDYGHDETEDLSYPPEVVVRPDTVEAVAALMTLCHEERIPVTPVGGRTGLSGGALSVHGGVAISMERFNRILAIDEQNLQATVEPGVITQVFQEAVMEKGLFYPPDPSSRGSCFLGGNLAENAGGPKAVKYGVTKDYVLNLEVVLPNGSVIRTGANVLKNATGYNLTQLMIGSEGTLGIITKIWFRLIPLPKHTLLLLVPFREAEKACESVAAVFAAGITPSALEFMERDAIDWTLRFVDDVQLPVDDGVGAHLLVEVDGNDMEVLFRDCEKITEVMQQFECGEILFAESS